MTSSGSKGECYCREPRTGTGHLWSKCDVDRWEHDKYVESEQGPKEAWEIEVTGLCFGGDLFVDQSSFRP